MVVAPLFVYVLERIPKVVANPRVGDVAAKTIGTATEKVSTSSNKINPIFY